MVGATSLSKDALAAGECISSSLLHHVACILERGFQNRTERRTPRGVRVIRPTLETRLALLINQYCELQEL